MRGAKRRGNLCASSGLLRLRLAMTRGVEAVRRLCYSAAAMTLDLNNTEIAFRSQSDTALQASSRLFRFVNSPTLVSLGTAAVTAALKLGLPIEGIIRNTFFRQFCGGETAEECQPVIQALGRFGIGTILDYAIEGTQRDEKFDSVAAEIKRVIALAQREQRIPFCVFKVTGVARFELLAKLDAKESLSPAEKTEWVLARARVVSLCEEAGKKGVRLFIDAEESWIQNTIDELAAEMMRRFNQERAIVYNTVQMYRTDRMRFLKDCHLAAKRDGYQLGLKIVRGAYMEKERRRAERLGIPSLLFPDKAATDASYDEALRFTTAHHQQIAICAGTHNEASTVLADSIT